MVRKVIGYWGIKTGVGSTLNSLLMAKRLKQLGFKVLLWDLNFKNPNIHLYCNSLDNIHNINNIFTFISAKSINESIIRDNIQKVEVKKNFELDYLRGISNLSFSAEDCVEDLRTCFNLLKDMYDYIVIDCANDLNNSGTYFSLSSSDVVFLVADNNVITVRQFDMFRQYLENQIDTNSQYLLINKLSNKIILPSEEIVKYLDLKNKEFYSIPYIDEEILVDAINKGDIIEFLISDSKIMNSVDENLDLIISERINKEVEVKKKKKKFGFLK